MGDITVVAVLSSHIYPSIILFNYWTDSYTVPEILNMKIINYGIYTWWRFVKYHIPEQRNSDTTPSPVQ